MTLPIPRDWLPISAVDPRETSLSRQIRARAIEILDELDALHWETPFRRCSTCTTPWPCATASLVEDARRHLAPRETPARQEQAQEHPIRENDGHSR